jgi:hypothetical protein
MAFPFQLVPADRPREVGGFGRRMRAGVAVKQVGQVLAITHPVAVGGIGGFLEGQEHRAAGHRKRRKGPRMKLVGQRVAQRVVVDGWHGRLRRLAGRVTRRDRE